MDFVGRLLTRYKYLAMFAVLFLCGLGLPIPEEVTLIASGLVVGWGEADFLLASVACVTGILAGDSIIFALGRYRGRWLMTHRITRGVFTRKRQARVRMLFSRNRTKAVFFARFVAGIRIVVYAYAGQHGVSWVRFLLLDLAGALITGPTSVAIGWFAAVKFADKEKAQAAAHRIMGEGTHWVYLFVAAIVLFLFLRWLWQRRRIRLEDEAATAVVEGTPAVDEWRDREP